MKQIKFLIYCVKYDNKTARVWYNMGKYANLPEGTITIYAREYGDQLPSELQPENHTETQSDYFDTDHARITPSNPYYDVVKKAWKTQQKVREKQHQKYLAKHGGEIQTK